MTLTAVENESAGPVVTLSILLEPHSQRQWKATCLEYGEKRIGTSQRAAVENVLKSTATLVEDNIWKRSRVARNKSGISEWIKFQTSDVVPRVKVEPCVLHGGIRIRPVLKKVAG